MISQHKSKKSLIFLTILLLPVKIRKLVFISVKHLSVLVRCSEHPEDITIPFHQVHSVGHHYDSACNNDHLVFLLDYIYYNVLQVGCRWVFDHYLLRITRTLFYATESSISYCFLYLVIFLQLSGKPIFSYSSCSDILSCFLRYLSIRALSSFINSLYH